MLFRPFELFLQTGADTELENAAVSQEIEATADDRSMRQRFAHVVFTQICMGIDMDDMQIRIFFIGSLDGGQAHEVLAADHQKFLAIIQYFFCVGCDITQDALCVAER